MMRLARPLAAAGLVLVSVYGVGAQQPPLSREEIARIKVEVTDAVHTYYRLFTERNMKALGERVYNVPWISIGAGGVQVDTTADAVTARFDASLKQLLAGGWDRSEFPAPAVCVLNAGAAIASGTFTRYKKDGSVMQENGVTYLFARTKDGWKIVSFTGHPVGKVVTCND
jgi:hypothetical protein